MSEFGSLNLKGKFFEIDESDSRFNIDKLRPESNEWQELWSKSMIMLEQYTDFWEQRIEIGKKCMRYMRADILTPKQRSDYKALGMIPVEPQEMKKVINSLSFQIKQSVQGSNVTSEDDDPPDSAAKPEVVSVVIKNDENRMKLDRLKAWARRDGLITGFPQWLWYDFEFAIDSATKQLVAYHPLWHTVLPTPYFERPDAEDIIDVNRIAYKSKAQLLENFPDRADALSEFESSVEADPGLWQQRLNHDGHEDASNRTAVINRAIGREQFNKRTGYYKVSERTFPVKKKQKLYVHEELQDVVMLPKDWSASRKRQWEIAHPEHQLVVRNDVKTLWTTTIGIDGFIWENKEHWYQDSGRLPGVAYVPDMIDNMPTGVGEDQLSYIISIVAAETAGLHQVRTGTGSQTFHMDGIFSNPSTVGKEMEKFNGRIGLKQEMIPQGGIDKVIKTFQRKPNETFFLYGDRVRAQAKDAHSVNDSITGKTHPRQSDVSKQTEIVQGMTPQSEYVNNYSSFELNNTQLLLNFIPYIYTEARIIRINDDYGQNEKKVQVNITEYDYSGQAKIIANDLTHSRYMMVPIPAEDTGTSRERELQQFINIISAVGNQLFQLNPRVMAHILSSMHNRYARQAGQFIMQTAGQVEQQQAQAAQAEAEKEERIEDGRRAVDWAKLMTPGVDFKMTPEQMTEAPLGAQLMLQYSQQVGQAVRAQGQTQQPQEQPGPQQ